MLFGVAINLGYQEFSEAQGTVERRRGEGGTKAPYPHYSAEQHQGHIELSDQTPI